MSPPIEDLPLNLIDRSPLNGGVAIARTNTLGIPVDCINMSAVSTFLDVLCSASRPALLTFVNPSSIALAARIPRYRQLLDSFDAVLPDGIGMCWAIRLIHGLTSARVSFDTTSIAPLVFGRAAQANLTTAIIGGRPGVAARSVSSLTQAFPGLSVVSVLDGYGDLSAKRQELRLLNPAIVICGMGAIAQEEFLLGLVEGGWRGVGFTCGGYLDQLSEGLNYYPKWIDAADLRWAYRLFREPRRLFRRYAVDYAFFAARLMRALISREPCGRLALRHSLQHVIPHAPSLSSGGVDDSDTI